MKHFYNHSSAHALTPCAHALVLSSSKGPLDHRTTDAPSSSSPPETNRCRTFFPIRVEHKDAHPQPQQPVHNKLFLQAAATCKAFPQAQHTGLINCRSLTRLSCSNSLELLCRPSAARSTWLQQDKLHIFFWFAPERGGKQRER